MIRWKAYALKMAAVGSSETLVNASVSYRALRTTGKKFCSRRLLLHKQNSNIYLKNLIRYVRKEKEANVQNINNILSDLS
jgi:hypothetical protein